jgi:hypothetical protein
LQTELKELIRKAIENALEGDPVSLKLCIEWLFPPCKDHPIHLTLPRTNSAPRISEALSIVLEAIGEGEITPNEGQMVANVLTAQIEIINTEEIDRRLKELEQWRRSDEPRELDKAA